MLSPDRCDCGLPFALIEGIEGRAEDILWLPAQSGGTVSIHPNVFHDVLEALPVQSWQVLEEPDVIRVLIARPEADIDSERLSFDIAQALERQGARARAVRVERVDAVVKTATGKAPLVRAWPPLSRAPDEVS